MILKEPGIELPGSYIYNVYKGNFVHFLTILPLLYDWIIVFMQHAVAKILDEKFDYERGSLELSTSRIELNITPGEVCTGSFVVRALTDRETTGYVCCNDIRMTIMTPEFRGEDSLIEFSFASEGLREGDVVQGEIYIISSQGEYFLPYVVSVQPKFLKSSLGEIKNLFHFANLAKANWDEAVKLFYSDEFMNLFTGNDECFKRVYTGLANFYGNEQNLEEFLLAINKKSPIEYVLEREVINVREPEGLTEEYINITRMGWGYTFLNVETDSDFVILSKLTLDDKDFLGNYLSYAVQLDASKLHAGVNYASITFFNSFVRFTVNVTVTKNAQIPSEFSRYMETGHLTHDMIVYYEAFRTKKITGGTWIAQTSQIVERMIELDEAAITPALFKAQLLLAEDRNNEAKWILDNTLVKFQEAPTYSPVAWAYYLYLTTLHNGDEDYINEVTEEVEKIYQMYPSEWRVAWLLLYLSAEFAVSPSKKWVFIEEQLMKQCTSPVFYVEAVNMLLINPALLNKLGEMEIRILRYVAMNDLFSEELLSQFVYLAGSVKEFDKAIYEILTKCYEVTPSLQIVEVIVEMLIKGGEKGPEYYEWFLRAVEGELRITRLYEYYMDSVDLNEIIEIPRMVYLYFSYQMNLEWQEAAYLYARAIEHREEMPDVYASFLTGMRAFAIDSIMYGHINRDVAAVVNFVIDDIPVSEELGEKLSSYIFLHRIVINDERIKKVIIYQYREAYESIFEVNGNEAIVPLYNANYEILLEDCFGNRYAKSIPYKVERLMEPGTLVTRIQQFADNNTGFNVYVAENGSSHVEIDATNETRYQALLDAPEIERDYKLDILSKLIHYYYDNDHIRELDRLLDNLLPEDVEAKERVEAISYMLIRGMYDKALEWIVRFGIEGIDIKEVMRLTSRLIHRNGYEKNEILINLAAITFFRGKYDDVTIKYLVLYYEGMTKNMRRIFSAAEKSGIENEAICERLLLQILYTGYYVPERIDIYRKFVANGGSLELQVAFLTLCSFEYFVKDQLTDSFIFEELTKLYIRGNSLLTVSKLAYLKFYAESEELLDEEKLGIIRIFLEDLIHKGIYMSFFKAYFDKSTPDVNRFSDKTIVEYKTDPHKKVYIHYTIEGDEDESSEYTVEEMKDMYGGVHAKAFVLFYGEKLLYYITEDGDEEEIITESASTQKSDVSKEIENSRFSEINDILIAKSMSDYDTANELIYEYKKRGYVIDNMFKLL